MISKILRPNHVKSQMQIVNAKCRQRTTATQGQRGGWVLLIDPKARFSLSNFLHELRIGQEAHNALCIFGKHACLISNDCHFYVLLELIGCCSIFHLFNQCSETIILKPKPKQSYSTFFTDTLRPHNPLINSPTYKP